MTYTQDLFSSRRNYADGNTRIGELDRIWYDPITNTMRRGDGVTPGGIIIGFGGYNGSNIQIQSDWAQTDINSVDFIKNKPATFGFTGSQGAAGPAGGYTGSTGLLGYAGSLGYVGYTGSVGSIGYTGSLGYVGSIGNYGYTGSVGAQGPQGYTGSIGFVGSVGAQGYAGSIGFVGSIGAQGPAGLNGDRYQTTSDTSFTLANNGVITLTVGTGLSYSVAQSVIIAYNNANHQHATVDSYDPATGVMVVTATSRQGSGTYSSWQVNLDGAVGAIGYTGSYGYTGSQGEGYTGSQGAGYTGSQGSPGTGGVLGLYGSFYDTTTQIADVIDTAYAMQLNTTAEANGVYVANDTNGDPTRVYITETGVYDIQFSAQLNNTGGGGSGTDVQIWLRVDGTDVPESNSKITVNTNGPFMLPAWNFVQTFTAGQYFQLMWSTDNVGIVVLTNTSVAPGPHIPSLILTVTQVMYTQLGYIGSTGYTGSVGSQGVIGYTGSIGPQGPQGAIGYTGSSSELSSFLLMGA